MARGRLVIRGGPGWFSRFLRRLGALVVMLIGLVGAGTAAGLLASWRLATALGDAPVAPILARDVGILTGSMVAVAVGFVLLANQTLSGWIRRLQAAADRHERNEATANAAGTVLVRLAPHLAYGAETDERVVDLLETVDVISGRSGTGLRRPIDLGVLLGECLDRRAPEFRGRDRELRRHLAADVWISAAPDRVALAVDHALRNAIEALGDEPGRVEVTLEASRGTAEIIIRDTGAEVPVENRHRLFDTGYSTKEGRPGLGLALIRRVAVDHGGQVELRHPWGGGTTLRIVLPRIKRPAGPVPEPVRPARPPALEIPEDAPAEDPVMVMPPPPPPPVVIPDEMDTVNIDADELLERSGATIPSPPTAIRERTGAPKYLPGEEPEDELPTEMTDTVALPTEPDPEPEPPAEYGSDLMGADTIVLDPEPEPEPDGPAFSDDAEDADRTPEALAEDEMKDFFGV